MSWFSELKVGDGVVHESFGIGLNIKIATVKRVTKRRVILEDGSKFEAFGTHGKEVGTKYRSLFLGYIYPLTKEFKETARVDQLKRLANSRINSLSETLNTTQLTAEWVNKVISATNELLKTAGPQFVF